MMLEMGFIDKLEEFVFDPRVVEEVVKLSICCVRAVYVYHREEIEERLTPVELDTIMNVPEEFDELLQTLIDRRKKENYLAASELESEFEAEELEAFKAAFKEFDEDASGTIDSGEIEALMQQLGVMNGLAKTDDAQEERLRIIIDESDLNDDGELDFAEVWRGGGDVGWLGGSP